MAEYKKEIGGAVAAAVLLALLWDSVAIYYFPGASGATGGTSPSGMNTTSPTGGTSRGDSWPS